MRKINLSSNFAIFLLFFGLSLFETLRSGNWGIAALWMAFGAFFLLADNLKRTKKGKEKDHDIHTS